MSRRVKAIDEIALIAQLDDFFLLNREATQDIAAAVLRAPSYYYIRYRRSIHQCQPRYIQPSTTKRFGTGKGKHCEAAPLFISAELYQRRNRSSDK